MSEYLYLQFRVNQSLPQFRKHTWLKCVSFWPTSRSILTIFFLMQTRRISAFTQAFCWKETLILCLYLHKPFTQPLVYLVTFSFFLISKTFQAEMLALGWGHHQSTLADKVLILCSTGFYEPVKYTSAYFVLLDSIFFLSFSVTGLVYFS